MARTARRRPARAAPSPPLRPSVQTACARACRARTSAQTPSSSPAGIEPYAELISVTRWLFHESTTPAGTASTASAATSTETTALGLLLLVGLAIGGRRNGAADHAGNRDQGE